MKNCPTCGCQVKVIGDVTKHYEPVSLSKEKVMEVIENEVELFPSELEKIDKAICSIAPSVSEEEIEKLADKYLEKIDGAFYKWHAKRDFIVGCRSINKLLNQ